MNISDFSPSDYLPLLITMAVSAGLMFAGVIACLYAYASVSAKEKLKVTPFVLRGAIAVVGIAAFCVSSSMLQASGDHADKNFARALSEKYGATSSVSYTDMMTHAKYDATLTRDGKQTLVRFTNADGKLTPVVLSNGEYPALAAK
jgi:hypothetical protein